MRRASGLFRRKSHTGPPPAHLDDDQPGDADQNPLVHQQKKTFRRWCNQYLMDRNLKLDHILKDWENGVLLCNLMEILAQTDLGKVNKTPKLELQKLENLNKALAFIGKHVKIVNIGSKDILSGNQTIIMGLLWTLILRWGLKLKDGKAGLLAWVNEKTTGGTSNFSSDWADGMKMAALVATLAPDALNINSCSPSDPVGNYEKAFAAAESRLGVARLLDPKDVVENLDEKSMIAYVGAIYNAANSTEEKKPEPSVAAVVVPVAPEVILEAPRIYNVSSTTTDVEWTFASAAGVVSVKVMIKPFTDDCDWPVDPGDDNKEFNEDCMSTSFASLTPSTTYTVRCMGIISSGKFTKPSEAVQFQTLDAGAPAAPRLYECTESSITCSWDSVPTSLFYRVKVDEGADGDFARTVDVESPSTSVVVDNLKPGTVNAFCVSALLSTGKETDPSGISQEKTLLPQNSIPPNVYDIGDRDCMVEVAAVAGAGAYEIQLRKLSTPWEDAGKEYTPVVLMGNDNTSTKVKGLEPNSTYEARTVAVSPAGVQSIPSPGAEFATKGPGPRYALVTEASSLNSVELVQSLLLIGSSTGEVGQDSGAFGFKDGFTNVFCFARDPILPELRELAESSRTLVVMTVDLDNPQSIRSASQQLPGGIDLIVNNGAIPRGIMIKLLG